MAGNRRLRSGWTLHAPGNVLDENLPVFVAPLSGVVTDDEFLAGGKGQKGAKIASFILPLRSVLLRATDFRPKLVNFQGVRFDVSGQCKPARDGHFKLGRFAGRLAYWAAKAALARNE